MHAISYFNIFMIMTLVEGKNALSIFCTYKTKFDNQPRTNNKGDSRSFVDN